MRQILALAVSIILAIIAVFAMKNYIDKEKVSSKDQLEMLKVVIADRRLRANTKIKKTDLSTTELPVKSATPDMVMPSELSLIVNRVLSRDIDRGGVIFESDFVRRDTKVSTGIPTGQRLLTISVDQVTGVGGLIHPRSKVDVLWTVEEEATKTSRTRNIKTHMLLSGVTVYAVDDKTVSLPPNRRSRRGRNYSSVTLVVTPQEATVLTSAQENGKLTLSLRSANDGAVITNINPIGSKEIPGLSQKANQQRQRKFQLRNQK